MTGWIKPLSAGGSTLPVAISYSGGGQSLALIELVVRGVVPRPEHLCVVWADTGAEHGWTYREVDSARKLCEANGIEFLTASAGSLEDAMLAIPSELPSRAETPPFWIEKDDGSAGVVQKFCTRHHKIRPIRREVSKWLKRRGLRKRAGVEQWIGYALDEAKRAAKTSQRRDVQWERPRYPLIELRMTRADVEKFLGRKVPFSMCVFCPHKNLERWLATDQQDRDRAIAVDDSIRDLTCMGLTAGDAFVSSELIPLRQLYAARPARDGDEFKHGCSEGACFL